MDLVAQGTQANQQVQAAAIADSSQLESFSLSTLSADDSSPPQVNYGTEQPLTASTPRASSTLTRETQAADTYCQIIPGMSECLYPTLVADGSLSTPAADNCSTLQKQITSELDKYLQEAAEKHEKDDNYYDDPTIVMGEPVTTAFISDDVRIPTEKVGCLQVTSQLQEFLNHFPPESIEKAFEQIYQILQVLDTYLIDNLQQHQYCMSPDSKYISLITYATKLEINLCNFPAIWAVLSILLDTKSDELQYVKNLQQVIDDYYEKHPTEVMRRLEQQTSKIIDVMYDSVTNQNFDRVSGVVDNDSDKIDTDNIQMPYDNDNDNATGKIKYE